MNESCKIDRVVEERINKGRVGSDSSFMCTRCSILKNSSGRLKQNQLHKRDINMCSGRGFSSRTSLNVLVLIWMNVTCLMTYCEGFNLDTSKAVQFDGPNSGSYFGFTVEMMNKDANNKWILFGAPKDQNPNLPSATEPGAVYKTTFTNFGRSGPTLLSIDDEEGKDDVDFNGTKPTFEHGRDKQWLGASIDVNENQGVVVCASRWYNRYFEAKDNITFMNGLCYLVPLDFKKENIVKIPALINSQKQTKGEDEWNYGMGCLGSAAHYTRSGNDVLLGTPGLWDWTGGFVDLRHGGTAKNYITQYDKPPTDLNEMAGYALSSGIYFKDGITYFAIGAPRQDLVGAVFLISSIKTSLRLPEADHILNGSSIDAEGSSMPVNAFFGATLCSVDVNNDGLDDLFVGAPMLSQLSTKHVGHVEEGAVFVFLGGDKGFQGSPAVLRGDERPYARFGSAISSVGDLNKDSYNDIVVGAPYEEDQEGAIYIYNGCKTGIFTKFSKRIPGSAVHRGIKSFGAALSSSYDMNGDEVNDVTVGAYMSDKAFLLHGQPVVKAELSIKSSVNLIDKDSKDTCMTTLDGKQVEVPCFQLQACASYADPELNFPFIDVDVEIVLDTYKEDYYRITFEENRLNTVTERLRIFSGETKCTSNRNVFIRSTSDLVTPVMVSARLLGEDIRSSSEITPTLNMFNGNEPDQPPLRKKKRLDFLKDCPDNSCETDLRITVVPSYTKHNGYFVLGTSNLDVDVTISKTKNPSYGSNLFVIIPKEVQFRKAEKIYGEPEISCGYVETVDAMTRTRDTATDADTENSLYQLYAIPEIEDDEKLLSCTFGNPMSEDKGVKFTLKLTIPGLISDTSMHFKFNATTLSTEMKPADNIATFDVEARNKLTSEFKGISRPAFITVNDEENIYIASHILELDNYGPSILPVAELTVRYPQVQLGGRAQLYLNKTTWSCRPPCKITCAFPDSEVISPQIHFGERGPTYYVDESPTVRVGESVSLTEINNADCAKKTCNRYECTLRNISPRESAVVALEFVINKELLEKVDNIVTFRTDTYVRFGAKERLLTNVMEHSTTVFTDVQPKSPPPEPIAWWIILISVLAGLILIAVMVLILWKCGFFVRKQRDEMEKRMQVEGKVMVDNEDNFEEVQEKKKPL